MKLPNTSMTYDGTDWYSGTTVCATWYHKHRDHTKVKYTWWHLSTIHSYNKSGWNLHLSSLFCIKGRQHPDFPGGHPPEYYPSLRLLNFAERTGYGVISLRWPSTFDYVKYYYLCLLYKDYIITSNTHVASPMRHESSFSCSIHVLKHTYRMNTHRRHHRHLPCTLPYSPRFLAFFLLLIRAKNTRKHIQLKQQISCDFYKVHSWIYIL